MNGVPCLVAPTRVARSPARQRWIERMAPAALRVFAVCSRRVLRGHGVGFACALVGRLVATGDSVIFQLSGGGTFSVPSGHRYWLKPLLVDRSYEPDLDCFLSQFLTPDDVFLDCGANLGLWSIAAAEIIEDPSDVVAIEPSRVTASRLRENCQANGYSFTVVERALSDGDDDTIEFYASDADPESATLVEGLSPSDAHRETVSRISLTELLSTNQPSTTDGLVVVKLDIEGVESSVLASVDTGAWQNVVLLYEDHGRDLTHQPTAFLLQRGFTAAFIDDDGSLERIDSDAIQRLTELKLDARRGYNLVAFDPSGRAAQRLVRLHPDALAPRTDTR
jgi:FkbM family methyltransferase